MVCSNNLNMKISYSWLKRYADITETPLELAKILTDCGLEVESIEQFDSVKGGLNGVFVGEVISCCKHPDADKLFVTRVDIGTGKLLPMVCGASNVAKGQKVLVATVGTTVNTNSGPVELKKVKIRGEVSEGMICAEDELGLGNSHEGIMVLPPDAPVGQEASKYFNVTTDYVFEIGLTPNRIDAACHIGAARDIVASVNQSKGKGTLKLKYPSVDGFKPDNNHLPIQVKVEDTDACPRYSGVTISGLEVKESPQWLKSKLLGIGQKPINNVVDVTNFVLHETGQPLHAFDAKQVKGSKVVVRKAPAGAPFVTLDGVERQLTGHDLMICNAEDFMCIGGILGGMFSGVTAQTTAIFLESAHFNPVTIRKSSKHHGLKTDASFRFERGSDPEATVYALKRAAMLIKEVAGGEISSEIVDEYPVPAHPAVVEFNIDRAAVLIGKKISHVEVLEIFENLDIKVLEKRGDVLILSIPTYRVDVTRQADVIEEILRIYGFNSVEVPERLMSSVVATPKPDKEQLQNIVSDLLAARGFNEIINNSLTKSEYFTKNGFSNDASIKILNPLSQDLNVLRQSLLFGGLETILYNQNRKELNLKLFEFGKIYQKDNSVEAPAHPLEPFKENMQLSIFVTGNKMPETWSVKETKSDFFDIKSEVLAVLAKLGFEGQEIKLKDDELDPIFEYGANLFLEKKKIASLGLVKKSITKEADIKNQVFHAIMHWETIVEAKASSEIQYKEIPKFPEVRRDLALLIDNSVKFSEIEKIAFEVEGFLLKNVGLFDIYHDKSLGENKKSYAVSFTLLDAEKTLTDKVIDKTMEKLIESYKKRLGAEIR